MGGCLGSVLLHFLSCRVCTAGFSNTMQRPETLVPEWPIAARFQSAIQVQKQKRVSARRCPSTPWLERILDEPVQLAGLGLHAVLHSRACACDRGARSVPVRAVEYTVRADHEQIRVAASTCGGHEPFRFHAAIGSWLSSVTTDNRIGG